MEEQGFILRHLDDSGKAVAEDFYEPERPETLKPLPTAYRQQKIFDALDALGLSKDGLWSHQMASLEAIDLGYHLSLTTQTNSGKSLVPQLSSLKKIIGTSNETTLTLFPARALTSDQEGYWKKAFKAAGAEDQIAKIDGANPLAEREALFKDVRALITTPDAAQAWLMRELDKPKHQDFIKNLTQINLDEAHLYEGYFGTSVAMLLRRIRAVRHILRRRDGMPLDQDVQIVASSATMSDPQAFIKKLTGVSEDKKIIDIGPNQCGSPSKARRIMRVDVPPRQKISTSTATLSSILESDPTEKTIFFMDTRTGVEKKAVEIDQLAKKSGNFEDLEEDEKIALPYRSGYSQEDREEIEDRFKDPDDPSRVLVTTSASEVGVNIKSAKYVVVNGIPEKQSSIIQRAGRLRGDGTVLFVGGHTNPNVIEKAFQTSPRDPDLHLDHEMAQLHAAMCFNQELTTIGYSQSAASMVMDMDWPNSFWKRYQYATNTLIVPEYLQPTLKAGKRDPHRHFSLRNSNPGQRRVMAYDPRKQSTTDLEKFSEEQFLKEAYPGAIFFQRGRGYRIGKPNAEGNVLARRHTDEGHTFPMMRKSVSAFLNDRTVSEIKCDPQSGDFIASLDLNVKKTLFGFIENTPEGSHKHLYSPDSPYSKAPIKFDQRLPAFLLKHHSLEGKEKRSLRERLAKEFKRVVTLKYSLSDAEVKTATGDLNIGYNPFAKIEGDDCLVVHDATPNHLGASHFLMWQFSMVTRLIAETTKSKEIQQVASELSEWSSGLAEAKIPSYKESVKAHIQDVPEGYIAALYPGSNIKVTEKGKPTYLATVKGVKTYNNEIFYTVEERKAKRATAERQKASAVTRSVPARFVEPSEKKLHLWSLVNEQTGEFVKPDFYDSAPQVMPIAEIG